MAMQIEINTNLNDAGVRKLDSGVQNLITKTNQAYRKLQEGSPIQAAADKQMHARKMDDLERKSSELERKIHRIRTLGMEGQLGPEHKAYVQKLGLRRQALGFERSDVAGLAEESRAIQAKRSAMIAPVVRAGRFTAGKALKYGSIGAGMLGAYSLVSGIMGQVGTADEMNLAYAGALSATRGKQGLDYSNIKPYYEVQSILEELGQTAYMTSKEMIPLLDVSKELADFSRAGAKGLIGVANIGKSLGVDTAVLSQFMTGGLQRGNFSAGGQYGDMAKMMMLNQNMMQRATESIQSMQQVMGGTMHGTQGLGAFGIFNLLDTLNSSGNRAFMGSGGASAALRFDQAFRGDGSENLQYMQTLALNPAFQQRNQRMAGRNVTQGPTNWGSGAYDQLIADQLKELGAFATPADLITSLKGRGISGAEGYIKKMYGGGMGKMNIQRLYDVYGGTFGAGKGEGQKMFMQAQMAKDLGISLADVGVFGEAIADPKFLERAKKGKLATGEYAAAFGAYKEGGTEGLEKYFKDRKTNEEAMLAMAVGIKNAIDELKGVMNQYLKPLSEITKEWLPEIAKTLISWFGTDEQKIKLAGGKSIAGPLGPIALTEEQSKRTIADALPTYMTETYRTADNLLTAGVKSIFPNLGPGAESGVISLLSEGFEKLKDAILDTGKKGESATKENTDAVKGNKTVIPPNAGVIGLD